MPAKIFNKGAYPTMITPYCADGSVDYATAEKYVQWYYDKGCNGIFSVCQSSEIAFLTLDERVKLNKTVYDAAQRINAKDPGALTVVSSGHVETEIDKQIYELNRIIESGTDALILITNRFDPNNEGDDVWLRNAEAVLKGLPEDIKLGLYECPAPYKRLVNPRILQWCVDTGRFAYMKDTCCDIDLIRERLDVLRGSDFLLFNANCQTLLASMRAGAAGYCGILGNFHPQLYRWLCDNFETQPEKADRVQALLGSLGSTEGGLPYPLSAKYHMCLEGIPTENIARNRDSAELTEYMKDCTRQLKLLTDCAAAQLGI